MGCTSSKTASSASSKNVAAASQPSQKAEVVAAFAQGPDKKTLLSVPASGDKHIDKKQEVSVSWDWTSEAERVFKLADKDGDGSIDMAELAKLRNSLQLAETMMGDHDTNGDGVLSLSEWIAYIKLVHDFSPAACKAFLESCEKNVSSWEWTSIEARRIFNLADKDGNGYIDKAELANLRNSEHCAEVMMGAHDTNKDGRLSLPEWLEYIKSIHEKKPAACKALLKSFEKHIAAWEWKIEAERISKAMEESVHRLFRSLDKNKDGKVVASEFLEFLRATTGSTSVTLQQAEKSLAFKDKNKDGALDEKELAIACEGVDAATLAAWCESLEKSAAMKQRCESLGNHNTNPTKSAWIGWFCCHSHATSVDEVHVGN